MLLLEVHTIQRTRMRIPQQLCLIEKVPHSITINHIDQFKTICTKTGIIHYLSLYYKSDSNCKNHYSIFDTTPTTFNIIIENDNAGFTAFTQRFKELAIGNYINERMPSKHCEKNLWLIKPAAMNQGRGIEVFSSLSWLRKFFNKKVPHSVWVVQKYIERPLLYFGRKFDIRIWGLVSTTEEFYIYKHGYLRTSSDIFNIDSNENWVHLTNNCLQKFGS